MSDLYRQPGESLSDFLKRRRDAEELGAPTPRTWDEDLVPTVTIEVSPERLEMDAVLDAVDMIEAYNRWCGKMQVSPGKKRANIMISCPLPGHVDAVPSADINLDLGSGGVWNCHRCQQGGDKYTIAAIKFGFDLTDYQSKENFPELRRLMAEDLGYVVMTAGKEEWLEEKTPTSDLEPEDDDQSLVPDVDPDEPSPALVVTGPPIFDWRTLNLNDDTFLKTWLELTSESYEPEEFYLFEGFMALAAAVGNHATFVDASAIRPNLMACMVGHTGSGKSIAMRKLDDLLQKALPFDPANSPSGVRPIMGVGSGEALIDQFCNNYTDSTGAVIEQPVNGFIRESELAALFKKMARQGNTIREVLMDLYDSKGRVSITSRTAGLASANNHFMQLISSIQPDALERWLTNDDAASGFLNRWVYILGTEKYRPFIATTISIDDAVAPLQKVRAWAFSSHKNIEIRDQHVMDACEQFYQTVLVARNQNNVMSRVDLLVKKLLLLFAINDRSTTITMQHLEQVMTLWPYIMSCYGIIDSQVNDGTADICQQEILEFARTVESFSANDFRNKRPHRKRFSRELIVKQIQILLSTGDIQEIPQARERGTGRPTQRYRLGTDGVIGTLTVIHGGENSG